MRNDERDDIIVTVDKEENGDGEGYRMKLVCEKCESSFKYEAIKDIRCCPVCGEPFEKENTSSLQEETGLMYFDQIMIFEKKPENSGVLTYCNECKQMDSLDLDKFEKLVDKEYVILKDNITVTCRGCGKEHKPRKILYKRKDNYASPLPLCFLWYGFY